MAERTKPAGRRLPYTAATVCSGAEGALDTDTMTVSVQCYDQSSLLATECLPKLVFVLDQTGKLQPVAIHF